jgi:predicted transposase YdaD
LKSDVPIKRLLQIRPEDWVAFLFPELDEIKLTDMAADVVPKAESRMDNVKTVNGKFICHIEPNGYLDRVIPARMLRYRADIWEYTMSKDGVTPPISQTLILFFEKHDNKVHSLKDENFEGQKLDYFYKVVKVWEIDPADVLNRKLLALYPLLPLMKHGRDKSADKIIGEAIEAINTVDDAALQSDFLSAMGILAGEKFSKKFVKNFIRREQLMESELFNEWVAEFVEEGEKRGIELGIERGIEKTAAAIKMLMKKQDVDEIHKHTELPIVQILRLKEEFGV